MCLKCSIPPSIRQSSLSRHRFSGDPPHTGTMNGDIMDSHLLSHYIIPSITLRHLLILKYNYSVLLPLKHTIFYLHIYIALRCLFVILSTLLQPFLDGLFCYNSGCMKCSIEAHIFVGFDPGAWLLQYPSHRHLNTVIDKFDCFGL